MKKIKFSLICIFFLFTSCGYTSLYNVTKFDFGISELNLSGDKIINRFINEQLLSFNEKKDANKLFKINLFSSHKKIITSKNSKGDATGYKITINLNLEAFKNDEKIFSKTYKESSTFNNLGSKFELRQYENIIIKDLTTDISQEIINNLSLLK